MSEIEVPDNDEPVVAYRCWIAHRLRDATPITFGATIHPSNVALLSIIGTHIWSDGNPQTIFDLQRPYMTSATVSRGCGFHAFKSPEVARSYKVDLEEIHWRPNVLIVVGEIYMWGRVFEHKLGYRSEHAQIKCLYGDDPRSSYYVGVVGKGLHVPVIGGSDDDQPGLGGPTQ